MEVTVKLFVSFINDACEFLDKQKQESQSVAENLSLGFPN